MDNIKESICESIDKLLKRIENSGAYITEDAKQDAKAIQKRVRGLELNSNIYKAKDN